jgi:hypothetical protein
MFHSLRLHGKTALLGRWCGAIALTACLGLSGCKNLNPGGDTLQDDPAFDMPRKLRSLDTDSGPAGLSKRSQQVERNLGIR